ncbi:MAG: DUF6125 family protein [Promethearchaeota archaeon]
MKKVRNEDKLFYFEKHFFTLDGLWMIEAENEVGWEKALKIDLEVWIRLFRIIIRRLKKHLNIKSNGVRDLLEILTFRWSVENWAYEVLKCEENEAIVNVSRCPYKSIMDRNPERHDKIKLICRDMCIPFYESITKDFNPDITVERQKYMGLGETICDFTFTKK